MQQPQVTRDAGNAQKFAVPIDEIFESCRIQFFLPRQIHEHPRIEVAATRSHGDASPERQPHARVDR